MKATLLLVLAFMFATTQAQVPSRLIASSFRGMLSGVPLVLSDSSYYTYGGARGGDLNDAELLFDRSYEWEHDGADLILTGGRSRTYNDQDHVLADTSLAFTGGTPAATGFVRWTRDGEGRPLTECWFQGADSIYYRSRSYTVTGKPAVVFYSQPYMGAWAHTTETYTYDALDSLTDKVVVSDFLGYSFHWDYSPEGWLTHHEELTPSGDLFQDYCHHPNGKLLAERDSAGPLAWMNDSVYYAWNAAFDTVVISSYNGETGFSLPNGLTRMAYDAQGQRIEHVSYESQAGEWIPLVRQATTWTTVGQVAVDSVFSWNGSGYVHVFNEEFVYDAQGNKLERMVLTNVDGTMVPVARATMSYNAAGQLLRAISEDTLAGGWITVTDQRYYYESYAVGFPERAVTDPDVRAWPDPADTEIRFTLPGSIAQAVVFALYDSSGKRSTPDVTGTGSDRTLLLGDLPAGVYFLQVHPAGTHAGFRFVRL